MVTVFMHFECRQTNSSILIVCNTVFTPAMLYYTKHSNCGCRRYWNVLWTFSTKGYLHPLNMWIEHILRYLQIWGLTLLKTSLAPKMCLGIRTDETLQDSTITRPVGQGCNGTLKTKRAEIPVAKALLKNTTRYGSLSWIILATSPVPVRLNKAFVHPAPFLLFLTPSLYHFFNLLIYFSSPNYFCTVLAVVAIIIDFTISIIDFYLSCALGHMISIYAKSIYISWDTKIILFNFFLLKTKSAFWWRHYLMATLFLYLKYIFDSSVLQFPLTHNSYNTASFVTFRVHKYLQHNECFQRLNVCTLNSICAIHHLSPIYRTAGFVLPGCQMGLSVYYFCVHSKNSRSISAPRSWHGLMLKMEVRMNIFDRYIWMPAACLEIYCVYIFYLLTGQTKFIKPSLFTTAWKLHSDKQGMCYELRSFMLTLVETSSFCQFSSRDQFLTNR